MIQSIPIPRREQGPSVAKAQSGFWWAVASTLLAFLVVSHFLVILCFALGAPIFSFIAPVAAIVSLAAGEALNRKQKLALPQRLAVPTVALVVTGISMWAASLFFDMSWDGLWYHQTAVYQMAHGWNPLYDPLHAFTPHLQDWVRHYAKGPWYVALALFTATGNIEMAKAAPWIALVATMSAVYAVMLDCDYGRIKSGIVALLVAANPVTMFELPSYLVDGLMVSFLACFVAAMIVWIKRPTTMIRWVMAASGILCINAKFTGLVYLLFACAAGGVYVIVKRRALVVRYVAFQSGIVLAAVLVFGFNPYMTNTLYRHHPFYPILGSAEYPSLAQQGEDPIEKWETPQNMMGTSRFVRLGYAILGRPGAQPYYPGNEANLMIPFDVSWRDFSIYYFHDVRISGFGPLFSGAFILALAILGVSFVRRIFPRELILIVVGTIILSLLISPHTWWARYGPQLWWVPIMAIIAGYAEKSPKRIRVLTSVLVVLLIVNVVPIVAVHFQWEANATRITHEQLAGLREKKNIAVDFQYFGEPFGERMRNAGVSFTPVQQLPCANPVELMSVSPGYPCAVRVCYADETQR